MEEIILTDKQKECVKFPNDRNLVVQGVAGSGKSLVIVQRAISLYRDAKRIGKNPRIIIFTFVNSLVDFTREILEQGGEDVAQNIEVSTLDSHIMAIYKKFKNKWRLKNPYGSYRESYRHEELFNTIVDKFARKYPKNRFFSSDKKMRQFLHDEVEWLKHHLMENVSEYLANDARKGRGSVRVHSSFRPEIFELYKNYYQELRDQEVDDFDLECEFIYNYRDRIPDDLKYDFVLIDEAQDLSLSKLLIAREVTKKAMTITADFAQKIYSTGFTWKEIGIDIRGQASKRLTGTHRNTKQIALLADCLTENNTELKTDADDYTRPDIPTREGSIPVLLMEPDYDQEQADMISCIKEQRKMRPNKTLAIICRKKDVYRYKKMLDRYGIRYEEIGGKEESKVLTPGVKIINYHKAKGLEFNDVLLPGLDEDKLPALDGITDEELIKDEMNKYRNLLYVAITRAKDNLIMFAKKNAPSPLIKELNPSYYNQK